MPKGVDAECRGEQQTEPEATGVGGCWRGRPVACQALHDEAAGDGAGDDGSVASTEARAAEASPVSPSAGRDAARERD